MGSGVFELLSKLFESDLDGRDLTVKELFEELGAADARDLGRLALGDRALGVPMDGCLHILTRRLRNSGNKPWRRI